MNLTLWWVKPLVALAVVAFLVGAVELFAHTQRSEGFVLGQAKLKAQYARQLDDANAIAATKAAAVQTQVETSHAKDLARADAQIVAGLAARTELDRLRDTLRRARPAAAASAADARPGPDAGPDYAGLLDACSVRYEAVAGDAGRLATQVIGLQGFVLAERIEGESTQAPVGARSRAGFIGLAAQPTTEPSGPTPVSAAPP